MREFEYEEECNLHAYGEHISIIQIYDRKRFYIVDVLSNGITDKSLEKLFSLPCEKIWFECHSDLAIHYKKHNIKATGVYDLRVLAKALGDIHGLDEVTTMVEFSCPPRRRNRVGQGGGGRCAFYG